MDRHQVRGIGVLVLLLWLLWLEASWRRGGTIFFNKVAAVDLRRVCRSQDLEALLAGHGG
jgi:hypothetical protein